MADQQQQQRKRNVRAVTGASDDEKHSHVSTDTQLLANRHNELRIALGSLSTYEQTHSPPDGAHVAVLQAEVFRTWEEAKETIQEMMRRHAAPVDMVTVKREVDAIIALASASTLQELYEAAPVLGGQFKQYFDHVMQSHYASAAATSAAAAAAAAPPPTPVFGGFMAPTPPPPADDAMHSSSSAVHAGVHSSVPALESFNMSAGGVVQEIAGALEVVSADKIEQAWADQRSAINRLRNAFAAAMSDTTLPQGALKEITNKWLLAETRIILMVGSKMSEETRKRFAVTLDRENSVLVARSKVLNDAVKKPKTMWPSWDSAKSGPLSVAISGEIIIGGEFSFD